MARVFSGIQPSGVMHLGNYLGAVRQWVDEQADNDTYYCIVDLHALTIEIDPATLRKNTIDTATELLAAGLDVDRCTLFVQSHVAAHAEGAWLLECVASYGELRRMTQFKEKGANQESVRASLLTYPVLMAADILLYDAERVPVGDDQRQHLELARDLAIRFNNRFGETFVIPEADIPTTAARVMDLQEPNRKMSKSVSSPLGTIYLDDAPDEIDKKIRRAVTDTENTVVYDPNKRPGVANLLELLSAATGRPPKQLAENYENYGSLKKDLSEALVEVLTPVRTRLVELRKDTGELESTLAIGAEKARSIAGPVLDRTRAAMGLVRRPH